MLRGADLDTLLERVRETYSQRAVSMLRVRGDDEQIVACVGKDPCVTVDSADTAIEVGDDEFWMLMSGRSLPARDRRVLTAVAKQAAGLVRQRELAEEASKAEAIEKADELRRSLLSAVSHDLRTPLAAAKAAVSSLRSEDIGFSEEDTAELLATIEESVDQLTALVGQPAGFVAAGRRRGAPRTASGSTSKRWCSARCSASAAASTGFGRQGAGPDQGRRRRRGGAGRRRPAGTSAGQPGRQRAALRTGVASCGSTPDGSAIGS